ncbi:MAG: hypothetical protein CM1200mP36_08840 [Gammaproteobacteria bacterium]|nr:MAG: hypothetical protein CM1200mP36_08840 [Gammaproteobacteria bacterium]
MSMASESSLRLYMGGARLLTTNDRLRNRRGNFPITRDDLLAFHDTWFNPIMRR